jgi:hypothetical protein
MKTYPASHVRVEGRERYHAEYGHYPRGSGHWAFEIGGETFFFNGMFTEAVMKAKKKAGSMGRTFIKVLL